MSLSLTAEAAKDKHCNPCNTTKPIEDFDWKSKALGRRQSRCRTCMRAYSKAHYGENKEAYVAKAKTHNSTYKTRNRAMAAAALVGQCCSYCKSEDELRHYAGGSDQGQPVWSAIGGGLSEDAVIDALGKAVIVCKACLGDISVLNLKEWQSLSHEQRLAKVAADTAAGVEKLPPRFYQDYVRKNETPAARIDRQRQISAKQAAV